MEPITPAAQAVDALISEYYKLVFHTIFGLTGDWEESQDLTQETFQKALKAIDDARAVSGEDFHPRAWLLRIAVNTVHMQHRRRNLFRFIPFSFMQKGKGKTETSEQETESDSLSAQAAPVQPAGYGAAEGADPAELVAERDAVQRTMARLSEPLRECLLLSVLGDFSSGEIATMLDLQEAAVRQRLARARKQFQQFYALESGEQLDESVRPVPSVTEGLESHKTQSHKVKQANTKKVRKAARGSHNLKSDTFQCTTTGLHFPGVRMRNDSIESLMQRHYGSAAHTPARLEQRLHASVRNTAMESQHQQLTAAHMRERRMSRRQAMRFVASSTRTTGLGLLTMGLESLQSLEEALVGQEATQTAYP